MISRLKCLYSVQYYSLRQKLFNPCIYKIGPKKNGLAKKMGGNLFLPQFSQIKMSVYLKWGRGKRKRKEEKQNN